MSKTTPTAEETHTNDIELTRYELMVLIDPNANSGEYAKHIDAVKKLLTDHGADIWHEEDWGKRELAYSIKKQAYGYYFIVNFNMEAREVPKVEEQLRILNFVMRHLALKVPADFTPQTYQLDQEEEKPKREDKVEHESKAKPAAPRKKPVPVKDVEPVPVEAETPETSAIEEASAAEATDETPEVEVTVPTAKTEAPEDDEAPAPKKAAKSKAVKSAPTPKVEDSGEADLSKLDAKLEELLSGDDDLNL